MSNPATIGHAILTHSLPAFAALQLAAAERHWSTAPAATLVRHDGAADDGNRAVAAAWGSDYLAGPVWQGYRAINPGVAGAIEWAAGRGLDWLVCHGRRWVPLWDVAAGLRAEIPLADGLPTIGNVMADAPRRPHARNEFFALRVADWNAPGVLAELRRPSDEDVMIGLHRAASLAASADPRGDWRRVLHPWPAAIGRTRPERPSMPTLWSLWTTPYEYATAARGLSLSGIDAPDFTVPGCRNCGQPDRTFDLTRPAPRFALCMFYTPDLADMGAVTSAAASAYATRHGYGFSLQIGTLDASRPPPWSKPAHLLRVMDDGRPGSPEWVWQLDVDALITDPARRLEPLAADDADLVFVEDVTKTATLLGINTGSWMLRNCPAVRRMLAEALARHDLNHHGLWEQQAVREWLAANPGALRLRAVRPGELNASPRQWSDGDFVCHWYGMPNAQRLAGIRRGRPSPDDVSYYRPDAYGAAAA